MRLMLVRLLKVKARRAAELGELEVDSNRIGLEVGFGSGFGFARPALRPTETTFRHRVKLS